MENLKFIGENRCKNKFQTKTSYKFKKIQQFQCIKKCFFKVWIYLGLVEKYKDNHIVMIWDNAPFHRKKELHEIEGLTPILLPSYSPELNPVERFYGEVRKSTANRLFKDIEIQKDIIEDEVVTWMADKQKTQKLCGYEWIIEQIKSISL